MSNGTSGTQYLDFGGTERGYIGNAGGVGAIVAGTTPGDFVIRAATGDAVISSLAGDVLLIPSSGNKVGIGTTTPSAMLHVVGTGSASINRHLFNTYWGSGFSDSGVQTSTPNDVTISASNMVHALGVRLFSDERIKQIQGISNGAADLSTLQGIQITDYRFKDVISRGPRTEKKVIAQQVEKVFPQAVSQSTDVVPDIYQKASIQNGWVELKTDLKKGERVRLIADEEEGIHEVIEVRAGAFRTAFAPKTDRLFVYGREVKDFRTVDYNAIAMLNVSATQELARQLEAQKQQNTELQERLKVVEAREKAHVAELTELKTKDAARDAKLAAIEQALNGMPKPQSRAIPVKTSAK